MPVFALNENEISFPLPQLAEDDGLLAVGVEFYSNLEPCYTIILAFLIFGEGREINFSFYIGITLILLSVLLQTMRAMKKPS